MTNSLAYYNTELITTVKIFMVQAPALIVRKKNSAETKKNHEAKEEDDELNFFGETTFKNSLKFFFHIFTLLKISTIDILDN